MHNINYSQPSPPTILLSNMCYRNLQILISKICYPPQIPTIMTASDKISYPVLVTTPSSCLFTCSLSPTFTHHRKAMTQSPLSILSHLSSLIFFSSIHKYHHYFSFIQCLLITQVVSYRFNIMHKSLLDI